MTAAISAAREGTSEVTVVTMDPVCYRRPAIPALIEGCINGPPDVRIFTPRLLDRYGIKLINPAEVTQLDTTAKKILLRHNGRTQQLSYDSAVIATGSHAAIPPVPGRDKQGVCTFTAYEGARRILEAAGSTESAVVVGAGFIALEIAEALMHRRIDVYFNVRSRILRRLIEPDLSEFLTDRFERAGLRMLTGQAISEIGGGRRVEFVTYKGGRIDTDLVVMGTGVRPSVELAAKAAIELGSSGAIKVNNRMETSADGIYAAGDCAESPDLATGRFVYMPVGSVGAMAGRIAGANAAGCQSHTPGFLRAQADEILGMQVFSIGHSGTSAAEVNLELDACDITSAEGLRQRADVEKAKILTAEGGRIVGAQLVTRRYGSQFAYQMYKAVLDGTARRKFLEEIRAPRSGLTATAAKTAGREFTVSRVGKTESLIYGVSNTSTRPRPGRDI